MERKTTQKYVKKAFSVNLVKNVQKKIKIFWIFSKKDSKKSWYIFQDFRVVYILPKHVTAFYFMNSKF